MNTKKLFILILIVAGVSAFLFSQKQKRTPQGLTTEESPNIQTDNSLLFQNKTMGAVEVEVTPVSIIPGDKTVFQISLNTHSLSLEYDYAQIIKLSDDQGNTYKALEWSGGNSGHHLMGNLIFESLTKDVQTITLNINGIDNQQASFQWRL